MSDCGLSSSDRLVSVNGHVANIPTFVNGSPCCLLCGLSGARGKFWCEFLLTSFSLFSGLLQSYSLTEATSMTSRLWVRSQAACKERLPSSSHSNLLFLIDFPCSPDPKHGLPQSVPALRTCFVLCLQCGSLTCRGRSQRKRCTPLSSRTWICSMNPTAVSTSG